MQPLCLLTPEEFIVPEVAVWENLAEDGLRLKEWDLFTEAVRCIWRAALAEKGRGSAPWDCIVRMDMERGQLTERRMGPVDDVGDEYDGDFTFLFEGLQFILPADRSNKWCYYLFFS